MIRLGPISASVVAFVASKVAAPLGLMLATSGGCKVARGSQSVGKIVEDRQRELVSGRRWSFDARNPHVGFESRRGLG